MPIGSVDQQLAFALEAFHREYLDEQSLGDALRQCLETGLCIDSYLVDAGLMTTTNVDSIVEFLDEQELGEDAWESVSDDLVRDPESFARSSRSRFERALACRQLQRFHF